MAFVQNISLKLYYKTNFWTCQFNKNILHLSAKVWTQFVKKKKRQTNTHFVDDALKTTSIKNVETWLLLLLHYRKQVKFELLYNIYHGVKTGLVSEWFIKFKSISGIRTPLIRKPRCPTPIRKFKNGYVISSENKALTGLGQLLFCCSLNHNGGVKVNLQCTMNVTGAEFAGRS